MNNQDFIAKAQTVIKAPPADVWKALTDPTMIKKYMFGATVTSNWEKGTEITWDGEMNGKKYRDKGMIMEITPGTLLRYTHFSPLSGKPDSPENYHSITISLVDGRGNTVVSLTQDNNDTEKSKNESAKNWQAMLEGLRKLLEE